MRRLIYSINVSLDGCCDHTKMTGGEEILHFYANEIRNAGLLAYGRITYQLMVPYWSDAVTDPSSTEPEIEFGKVFDAADKVVFSQSLDKVEDKNSRLVRTKPEDEIRKLKQEKGKDILLGGVALPVYLIERGLVDEYLFVVQPVVAGEGRRLLEGISLQDRMRLKLVDSNVIGAGCVALRYRPQG
jgi:dihydrofolate reductase